MILEENPGCPLIIGGDFNINTIPQHHSDDLSDSNIKREWGETLQNMDLLSVDDDDNRSDNFHSGMSLVGYTYLESILRSVTKDIEELIFKSQMNHPATRPPTLAFPSYLNQMIPTRFPQRHDYLFFSPGDGSSGAIKPQCFAQDARLERFIAGTQSPYLYLSDHFGISFTLKGDLFVKASEIPHRGRKVSPREKYTNGFIWGDARKNMGDFFDTSMMSEKQSKFMELIVLPAIAIWLFGVPWMGYVVAALVIFSCLNRLIGNKKIKGVECMDFGVVFKDVSDGLPGEAVTEACGTVIQSPNKDDTSLTDRFGSVWEMWSRAAELYAYQPCILQRTSDRTLSTLSFKDVESQIQSFGSGLLALGVTKGSHVGILCGPTSQTPIIDLACLAYGITTVTLAGNKPYIRKLLDNLNITICISSKAFTPMLFECRSSSLKMIIQMEEVGVEEAMLAQNNCIKLRTFDEVINDGYQKKHDFILPVSREEELSRVVTKMVSLESDSDSQLDHLTNRMLLQSVEDTFLSKLVIGIIPWKISQSCTKSAPASEDIYAITTQSPFTSLFDRIITFAAMAAGASVIYVDNDPKSLQFVKPTVLVCRRAYISNIENRVNCSLSRLSILQNYIFRKVYRFRSRLIRHQKKDSPTLNFLFFGYLRHQIQLPTTIKRVIESSPNTTCPYRLRELISLLITPIFREAIFTSSLGLIAVDGTLIPGTRALLDPINQKSVTSPRNSDEQEYPGKLSIRRSVQQPFISADLAALWKDDKLYFYGSVQDLLWPLGGVSAVASELEATYKKHCPLIRDIYITCEPNRLLFAIVVPNRGVVEDMILSRESQVRATYRPNTLPDDWRGYVEHAEPIIKEYLKKIAVEHLPPAHSIDHIHIHPHHFYQHRDFFFPSGILNRSVLRKYFEQNIMETLCDNLSPMSPKDTKIQPFGIMDKSVMFCKESVPRSPHEVNVVSSFSGPQPSCAISIDIGGTCGKMAFFQPPNAPSLPSYCTVERDETTHALPRCTRFFCNVEKSDLENSNVGVLKFVKFPTKDVPRMIRFMSESNILGQYKSEALVKIPATGGGALKFSSLVTEQLHLKLTQVKEMDSITSGINFILRHAPNLVFTFDIKESIRRPLVISSEERKKLYPYLLVNIGSGVSFVKCISPSGEYERVGGTPVGGGTFLGLVRLLTSIRSWDEIKESTRIDGPGDNSNVDLLVGDIYGFNGGNVNLPAKLSVDTIASSFGKIGSDKYHSLKIVSSSSVDVPPSSAMEDMENLSLGSSVEGEHDGSLGGPNIPCRNTSFNRQPIEQIDVVRSLLVMIANNITQIVSLTAKVEKIDSVFFTGGFVRDNAIAHRQITQALNYWSNGKLVAHFMQPDGYVGTIGSLLCEN
eukprot:Tbor_TRINITY_DN4784_c0_g1::TRINITY_DN4784_c0_g1_i1::g.16943::m.16943/K09680/coaW; type II pantothenate kinase